MACKIEEIQAGTLIRYGYINIDTFDGVQTCVWPLMRVPIILIAFKWYERPSLFR